MTMYIYILVNSPYTQTVDFEAGVSCFLSWLVWLVCLLFFGLFLVCFFWFVGFSWFLRLCVCLFFLSFCKRKYHLSQFCEVKSHLHDVTVTATVWLDVITWPWPQHCHVTVTATLSRDHNSVTWTWPRQYDMTVTATFTWPQAWQYDVTVILRACLDPDRCRIPWPWPWPWPFKTTHFVVHQTWTFFPFEVSLTSVTVISLDWLFISLQDALLK
jgi:hypothetical protein